MKEIKSKVYYEIATGDILMITSEMKGCIEEATKEDDITMYEQLKGKDINEVDYIELDYGTLATTFENAKSYKVNLENKQLEVIYYTQEELNAIQQQNQETLELNVRVSDISQYLQTQDTVANADIEDYILQAEINKVINGGM